MTLNLAGFIGLLTSNYQNTTVLDYQQCTNMGQSALLHVNADLVLVLARPFQSQTILFQWMDLETMQLFFVQSVLN